MALKASHAPSAMQTAAALRRGTVDRARSRRREAASPAANSDGSVPAPKADMTRAPYPAPPARLAMASIE